MIKNNSWEFITKINMISMSQIVTFLDLSLHRLMTVRENLEPMVLLAKMYYYFQGYVVLFGAVPNNGGTFQDILCCALLKACEDCGWQYEFTQSAEIIEWLL